MRKKVILPSGFYFTKFITLFYAMYILAGNFVHNVFEQLRGHEVEYSCNQVISRIVDTLLPLTSDEVIFNFMGAFDTELRITIMDPFASHVIEKLIVTCLERYQVRTVCVSSIVELFE